MNAANETLKYICPNDQTPSKGCQSVTLPKCVDTNTYCSKLPNLPAGSKLTVIEGYDQRYPVMGSVFE